MSDVTRRQLLQMLGAAPVAGAFAWSVDEALGAQRKAQAARKTAIAFKPKFFTDHEYRTVQALVDQIIPRDERSGSATDAGVPQFMDFMMIDRPVDQVPMRGGLALIDVLCQQRFDRMFADCDEAQRRAVLDDLAWPARAKPELLHGVAFFNSFRDLTATGFWSSKMGVEDLRYQGNTFVAEWRGCPSEVLVKLGLPESV